MRLPSSASSRTRSATECGPASVRGAPLTEMEGAPIGCYGTTTRRWHSGARALPAVARAQAPAPSAAPAASAASAPAFTQEQLDSLVAPIALYPDKILVQVLMAATYPLDVVEASRFVKANRDKLKGDAMVKAAEEKNWDPSVQSLTMYPQVLEMMNEKLEWTQQLGDAVLAD